MRNEVPEQVLSIIDQTLLSKGKRNIYTVLESLGVRDADNKKFDWAWQVSTGGAPIFTIWAEDVAVHPSSGRMFYVEDLNERTTLSGGGAMDANQIQRAQERRRLMERVRNGDEFIAVLQTNVRSRDELMQNEISKPADRVKDSPWHVARWDDERKRAVLVRGSADWAPSDDEVDQFVRERRIDILDVPPADDDPRDDGANRPALWFPDQEHRDLVEAASMAAMVAHYKSQGLAPFDVSDENRGYDLDVRDRLGTSVHHAEVKGTSSLVEGFFLTRNEYEQSQADPLWELAIVTNALAAPDIERYSASEMERRFGFQPLVWRCDLKSR